MFSISALTCGLSSKPFSPLIVNGIVNSSPASATYMRQWTWLLALVQIMACRLFGAKPLSKPILGYYQLDPYEQSSVKFPSKYKTFHSLKCIWRHRLRNGGHHYDDVIMTMLASQITSLTVVYSIVYSGVNQRKHQSSASLAFVREIHRGPVNFPHKWPVTRKMFPFDDVIMFCPGVMS